MTLKLKKCAFSENKVDFLGHTILSGKLAAAVRRWAPSSKAILEAPSPTDESRMRSFLGSCNVYRRLLHTFSGLTRPFNSMLKKDSEIDWEALTKYHLEAFNKLKNNLANPPILSFRKWGAPYIVYTDASKYALIEVLLQEEEVEGEVAGKPEKGGSPLATGLRPEYQRKIIIPRQKESASLYYGL